MLTLHTRICIVQSTLYKLWHKQPLPCTVFFTTLDHCHYTIPIKPHNIESKTNGVPTKENKRDRGLSLIYMCSISQKRLITLHGVHKLDNFMPKSRQKNSLIRQVGWYSGLKWITCHIQALLCSIRFTRSFFMTKLRLVALQFWSTKHGLFSLSLSKTMWSTHYHLRHVGPFPIFSLKPCVTRTIISDHFLT